MTGNALHRVREVADHFSVTHDTVIGWIKRGQLNAVRLASGQYRITEAAFQQLIQPVPGKKTK